MAVDYKGQLLSLAQSLHRLRYYPGCYENIPTILNGIHLGVIPPLWEDNLPQVTFELLAAAPVMCSNRGGAQEFVRHPASFIFDPAQKATSNPNSVLFGDHPHLLTEFWLKARQSVP